MELYSLHCFVCGKTFPTQCAFDDHVRTLKFMSCRHCNLRFHCLCYLWTHNKIHTCEPHNLCSYCGMSFSRFDLLKAHTLVHCTELQATKPVDTARKVVVGNDEARQIPEAVVSITIVEEDDDIVSTFNESPIKSTSHVNTNSGGTVFPSISSQSQSLDDLTITIVENTVESSLSVSSDGSADNNFVMRDMEQHEPFSLHSSSQALSLHSDINSHHSSSPLSALIEDTLFTKQTSSNSRQGQNMIPTAPSVSLPSEHDTSLTIGRSTALCDAPLQHDSPRLSQISEDKDSTLEARGCASQVIISSTIVSTLPPEPYPVEPQVLSCHTFSSGPVSRILHQDSTSGSHSGTSQVAIPSTMVSTSKPVSYSVHPIEPQVLSCHTFSSGPVSRMLHQDSASGSHDGTSQVAIPCTVFSTLPPVSYSVHPVEPKVPFSRSFSSGPVSKTLHQDSISGSQGFTSQVAIPSSIVSASTQVPYSVHPVEPQVPFSRSFSSGPVSRLLPQDSTSGSRGFISQVAIPSAMVSTLPYPGYSLRPQNSSLCQTLFAVPRSLPHLSSTSLLASEYHHDIAHDQDSMSRNQESSSHLGQIIDLVSSLPRQGLELEPIISSSQSFLSRPTTNLQQLGSANEFQRSSFLHAPDKLQSLPTHVEGFGSHLAVPSQLASSLPYQDPSYMFGHQGPSQLQTYPSVPPSTMPQQIWTNALQASSARHAINQYSRSQDQGSGSTGLPWIPMLPQKHSSVPVQYSASELGVSNEMRPTCHGPTLFGNSFSGLSNLFDYSSMPHLGAHSYDQGSSSLHHGNIQSAAEQLDLTAHRVMPKSSNPSDLQRINWITMPDERVGFETSHPMKSDRTDANDLRLQKVVEESSELSTFSGYQDSEQCVIENLKPEPVSEPNITCKKEDTSSDTNDVENGDSDSTLSIEDSGNVQFEQHDDEIDTEVVNADRHINVERSEHENRSGGIEHLREVLSANLATKKVSSQNESCGYKSSKYSFWRSRINNYSKFDFGGKVGVVHCNANQQQQDVASEKASVAATKKMRPVIHKSQRKASGRAFERRETLRSDKPTRKRSFTQPFSYRNVRSKLMKCKPMPLRSFASPPINEQRRQSRINFSTIKMVHKCNHCSESYSSSSALFNHKRSIHKDQFKLKCMHCKAMFCMFKRFCSHLRRYHINKKSFKCTFCARNFYMMGKLINHMRTHVTDQKSHKSSGCEETFDTLSELRNGSSSRKLKNQSPSPNSDDCEETSEVFACTRCGKEFTTTSLLSSHVCARGGTKSHACVLCRQVFSSVRRLQKHLICHAVVTSSDTEQRHKKDAVFTLIPRSSAALDPDQIDSLDHKLLLNQTVVDLVRIDLKSLKVIELNGFINAQQYAKITSKQKIRKSAGKGSWKNSNSRRAFEEEAIDVKPVLPELRVVLSKNLCDVVSAPRVTLALNTIRRKYRRKRHRKPFTKLKKKLFDCTFCGKAFRLLSNLHIHQQRAHFGEACRFKRRHVCSVCGEAFSTSYQLTAHKKIHTGVDPFVCKVCNKAFSNKQNVIRHEKIHSVKKRIACEDSTAECLMNISSSEPDEKKSIDNPYICEVCSKAFPSKYLLSGHQKIHTRQYQYSCDVCSKVFSMKQYLMNHKKIHSGEKPYNCGVCSKAFSSKYYLITHEKIHSGEKPYSCDVCNEAFFTYRLLINHKRIHSGEKPYSCDVCSKAFSINRLLINHKRIHSGEKPYSCDVCSKAFSSKQYLILHKKIHSGEKPFSCDVCSKAFSINRLLINHKRIHSGEKPYSCDVCSKAFSSKQYLILHEKIHSGEKPYSCDVCSKAFSLKRYLIFHKKIHSGEKPYSCDVCSKAFSSNRLLINHKRIHSGEKPYSCDVCSKAFSINRLLINHKRIHSGEKPYSCDVCSKAFTSKPYLMSHKKVHSGEKPYSCDACSKVFRWKHRLVNHKKMHSGTRPYVCGVCGKSFSAQHLLVRHARFHTRKKPYVCVVGSRAFALRGKLIKRPSSRTGEKPFVCGICSKTFSSQGSLHGHRKTHNSEKPYVCGICPKSFFQQTNLKIHQKVHSGSEKPLVCVVCNQGFMQRNHLLQHQRIHSREKPHVCGVCSKAFAKQQQLINHGKMHTSEKQKVRPVCRKAFAGYRPIELKHKNKVRPALRSHICRLCNMAFYRISMLVDHLMKAHNPEEGPVMQADVKPTVCQICLQVFVDNRDLKAHLSTHLSGEKPYACDICDRRFTNSSYLSRHHKLTHSK